MGRRITQSRKEFLSLWLCITQMELTATPYSIPAGPQMQQQACRAHKQRDRKQRRELAVDAEPKQRDQEEAGETDRHAEHHRIERVVARGSARRPYREQRAAADHTAD